MNAHLLQAVAFTTPWTGLRVNFLDPKYSKPQFQGGLGLVTYLDAGRAGNVVLNPWVTCYRA